MSAAYEYLQREHDAAVADHRVVSWIRVTDDAIEGSPVCLSMTPERHRGVFGHNASAAGRVELLLHPADWELVVDDLPLEEHERDYLRQVTEDKPLVYWSGRVHLMGLAVIW